MRKPILFVIFNHWICACCDELYINLPRSSFASHHQQTIKITNLIAYLITMLLSKHEVQARKLGM